MERFYDGDPEQLYAEARVINPFRKPVNVPKKVFFKLLSVRSIHCD